MEENFICRDPMLYKVYSERSLEQEMYKLVPMEVPIGKVKYRGSIIHSNNAPEVKYKQKDESSCYFWCFTSAFAAIGGFYSEQALSSRIEESLQFCSPRKQGRLKFSRDVILSHRYFQRRVEIWIKYDIK